MGDERRLLHGVGRPAVVKQAPTEGQALGMHGARDGGVDSKRKHIVGGGAGSHPRGLNRGQGQHPFNGRRSGWDGGGGGWKFKPTGCGPLTRFACSWEGEVGMGLVAGFGDEC